MTIIKLFLNRIISYTVYIFLCSNLKLNKKSTDIKWANIYSRYYLIVDINRIFIHLKKIKEIIPLNKSPHYIFINNFHKTGNKNSVYRSYIKDYFRVIDLDAKEEEFLELYRSISKSIDNKSFHTEVYSLTKDIFLNKNYVLFDGVHRAAILHALGIKKVKVNLIYKVKVKSNVGGNRFFN